MWRRLRVRNALAYRSMALITAVKSFLAKVLAERSFPKYSILRH
jgi:hypothetical protein